MVAIFFTCHALCKSAFAHPEGESTSSVEAAHSREPAQKSSAAAEAVETREPVPLGNSKRAPIYTLVVGEETTHLVQPGDTPAALARRYKASLNALLRRNRISDPRRLRIGQRLIVSNRHIVPAPFTTGLVVDLPLLRLYWIQDGKVLDWFPIAAGRPAWETPPGVYRVIGRRRNPTWYVPPSIQREMQAAGLPVRKRVPPGPDNPLGKYWIQLSAPGIGLHGTNAPWSVGRYATHGCIRLHEEHIERLFHQIPDGTPVAIVEDPVRLAKTTDGRIFLEAFERPEVWPPSRLKEVLNNAQLIQAVDWPSAAAALAGRWGIAAEITAIPVDRPGLSTGLPVRSHRSTQPPH